MIRYKKVLKGQHNGRFSFFNQRCLYIRPFAKSKSTVCVGCGFHAPCRTVLKTALNRFRGWAWKPDPTGYSLISQEVC
jgi:hypothetical protein